MAGQSVGLILDKEVDVSRGDWLLEDLSASSSIAPAISTSKTLEATLCWLDDEPLVKGRTYLALHGHQWVKAQVSDIVHRLDILSLAPLEADHLKVNEIGVVKLSFKEALPVQSFQQCRLMGSMILVDPASHTTSGAVLIQA
jgi:sulfate adenylyltransferase subunit 1